MSAQETLRKVRPSRALAMSHKSRRAGTRVAAPASDAQITPPAIPALNSALTASTSSGYSTSDEQATAVATRPPAKSTKRKTRAPATPNSPLLKRIRVDASPAEQPPATSVAPGGTSDADGGHPLRGGSQRPNVVCTKPPLPPAKAAASRGGPSKGKQQQQQVNGAGMVNKLKAYADQCRTEIGELKVALANEKAAVRTLRAQNEADIRRLKSELKRTAAAAPSATTSRCRAPHHHSSDADGGGGGGVSSAVSQQPQPQQQLSHPANVMTEAQCQPELKKLRTENCILRDANKQLEDKNQIFCKADRQKTNDVRQVKESYEQKLAQMSKSANVEIHRLLDEIKSKDKALEALRKEAIDLRSISIAKKEEQHHHQQHQQHNQHNHNSGQMRKENVGDNNTKTSSNTISYQKPTSINATHGDEAELLNAHDMHERIPGTHINGYSSYCGTKDLPGSDNDSALSSAPPSLSPQPGIFSNSPDEWNLFAKDCKELQNLRKDYETTQEENQFLNFELAAAKEQIETLEKTIFVNTDGNKCDELYQRISYLERGLEGAQKEAYELREQNELLEFRNIELEESFEKSKAQQITDNQTDAPWRTTAAGSAQPKTHAERMVATVQPYSTLSTDDSDRKTRQTTTSLPLPPSTSSCTQCTQTDAQDFACGGISPTPADQTSADLSAEIQKLNRFRKKIEQCSAQEAGGGSSSSCTAKLLATNAADARRLQFYKDRLEQLENKVLVYESTGDVQTKRLADRLQRELQLDACVKRLTERCAQLVQTNRALEEEKCEFEEAENDARHLLQKLEIELEMFRQRNNELEMMGEAARAHANCLEDTVAMAHERIQVLEEHKSDLKEKLDMLTSFLPSMLLCAEWRDGNGNSSGNSNTAVACRMDTEDGGDSGVVDLPSSVCQCIHSRVASNYAQSAEFAELQRLMERERALKQNIEHLNRVYGETLENADTVWAQLEADYKQQVAEAQAEIGLLKSKIYQLEDRLQNDGVCAAERIAQLEESEALLQRQLAKAVRDQKQHGEQLIAVQAEFEALADKYAGLKAYLNGPMAACLEKERRRTDAVQEELRLCVAQQADAAEVHRGLMAQLRAQLNRTKKEVLYINVSNGELKEEVDTLEHRLVELEARRRTDEETIKSLSHELHGGRHDERSDSDSGASYRRVHGGGQQFCETLAQELQHAASLGRVSGRRRSTSGSLVKRDMDDVDGGGGAVDTEVEMGEDVAQFGDDGGDDDDDDGGGRSMTMNIGCYMSRTEL